jgi:hypothetical protein
LTGCTRQRVEQKDQKIRKGGEVERREEKQEDQRLRRVCRARSRTLLMLLSFLFLLSPLRLPFLFLIF